jgi:hypothetical protein
MSAPSTVFAESIANLTRSVIVEPLVDWLRNTKGVEVTVEEIIQALNIPATPRFQTNYSAVPLPLKGAVASKPRASSSKNIVDPNATPCVYVFTRGKNKGETCGQPSVPGTNLCPTCSTKTSANKYKTMMVAPRSAVLPTVPTTTPTKASSVPIDVEPYGDKYLDRQANLILEKQPDGTMVATGVLENNQERCLTKEEEDAAIDRGISLPTKNVLPIQVPKNPLIPSLNNPAPFIKPTMPTFK